eukprot:PhM_4_TR161/c0_g1_i1/m.13822
MTRAHNFFLQLGLLELRLQLDDTLLERVVLLQHHLHGGPRGRARHELVVPHPLVVDELRHVVADPVGEDHDNALALGEPRRGLLDTSERGAAAAAAEEALVAVKHASELEGLLVLTLDPLVDERAVEHVGDEVITDALDVVRAHFVVGGVGEDRADGVDSDDLCLRRVLLEVARDAGERAAGASANDEHIDLAAALLQDLRGRATVVRIWVVDVFVLVKDVVMHGVLLAKGFGDADVGLGAVPGCLRGSAHNVGAEGFQNRDLLAAHLLRQRDDHAALCHGRSHRHAHAGVAGGGFDEGITLLYKAALDALLHHAHTDAVLDAAAGIEELALGDDFALEA